ncbi:hypothetical protein [Nocardia sp. CA-119907]|uniref:hypothetical protein n=1 Tax=Nocardia sp. CA-119907 TaxID=3239973 RepID=UPI003D979408
MTTSRAVASSAEVISSQINIRGSHPRSNRWTYLVRPDLPDDDSLFAEMFRSTVSVVRAGGTIALPSPSDRCAEFRRWIEPPRCTFRPSGRNVVDTIRACTGSGRSPAVSHPLIGARVVGDTADVLPDTPTGA